MAFKNDTWDVYKNNKGEWEWRRTAPNGEIVGASTEGYVNKADCISNANRHGYDGRDDTWEFYQDQSRSSEWRWRRTAPNGEIVGASTEGYTNESNCIKNAQRNGYSGGF